jgi:hypothetical protein
VAGLSKTISAVLSKVARLLGLKASEIRWSDLMEKKSKRLKKFALLVGSLSISLLLAEGAVRLCLKRSVVLYPRFHVQAQYGEYTIRCLRPNTTFRHRSRGASWKFVTNSKGFRSEVEHSYDKPDGLLRVICLGDSNTQGFECRQDRTYSSVIQRFLQARGIPADVINTGVSGFSTAEELVFLENEGIRYHPDVIVLGFFANDLDDNVKADLFRLEEGELVTNSFIHAPATRILKHINNVPPLRWLSQHSYLYSVLFNRAWDFAKRRLLEKKTQSIVTEYAAKQADKDEMLAGYKQVLGASLLKRMFHFCRTHGIYLLVMDIPRLDARRGWESSVPPEMMDSFRQNCDALIFSRTVLEDFSGTMDVFVPHGHRHISEQTHMLLGVAAAKQIAGEFSVLPSAPDGRRSAKPDM